MSATEDRFREICWWVRNHDPRWGTTESGLVPFSVTGVAQMIVDYNDTYNRLTPETRKLFNEYLVALDGRLEEKFQEVMRELKEKPTECLPPHVEEEHTP